MSEFNLSELRTDAWQGRGYIVYPEKDVKEFIKKDTKFLDINEQLVGFQLSDVVVTAINLMFSQRTKKLAGDKLV